MTKPTFTPGPWRSNNTLIEGPRMALSIASVYTGAEIGHAAKNENEWKANARLIAAAPDLYAALRWAANMAEEAIVLREASDDPADHEMLVKARAALVKAVQS